MTPNTAQDFVGELRRTHLIDDALFNTLRADVPKFDSARAIATHLIGADTITRFQAEKVLQGGGEELHLGPFVLLEQIARGDSCLVLKAFQPRLNRTVALKMIRPDILKLLPDAARRLDREALATAQLHSPYAVVLYDLYEFGDTSFLALEYLDGMDLAMRVYKEGALPVPLACDYIRQAATGLQHAHEAGLVHRDIKPSHLLVTGASTARNGTNRFAGGVVKILDMGVARVDWLPEPEGVVAANGSGAGIGTPDFVAPEQAKDASKADIRADIYSLGCTFYHLLCGQPPFGHCSPEEKLAKHQQEEPRPLEEVRPGIPAPLLGVVKRMMCKRPFERFETPQEVADTLAQLEPVISASWVAASDWTGRAHSRSEMAAAPAATGRADVVVPRKSTVYQPTAQPPTPTRSRVIHPARRKYSLKAHGGYVTGVAFSLDGRRLATGGLDGKLFIWQLSGEQPTEEAALPSKLGDVQRVVFSPTEQCVYTALAAKGGLIWRWDWAEKDIRKSLTVAPSEPLTASVLAVSADGKQLAAGGGNDILAWTLARPEIGRSTMLKGHGKAVRALAFAPAGRRLASAHEDGKLAFWEFGWFRATRKALLTGHADVVMTIAFAPNGMMLASGGSDGRIGIWDTATDDPRAQAVLSGHSGPVRLVQFVPPEGRLISVGDGGEAILWDVATKAKLREWAFDKGLAANLTLSPDGRLLAVGANEQVQVYELEQPAAG
ncbi:MAG TPA: serine/threonine-protein kinase [Gemmataceae bacterium]|nr:serine/threonine-protein kinase [Gemmataceae bacterium]